MGEQVIYYKWVRKNVIGLLSITLRVIDGNQVNIKSSAYTFSFWLVGAVLVFYSFIY